MFWVSVLTTIVLSLQISRVLLRTPHADSNLRSVGVSGVMR